MTSPNRLAELALDRLAEAEDILFSEGMRETETTQQFSPIGSWYIRTDYLRKMLAGRFHLPIGGDAPDHPILRKFSTLALLWQFLTGARLESQSRADLIRISTNVRGFYFSTPPVTIKANHRGIKPVNLVHELEFRQQYKHELAQTSPQILQVDEGGKGLVLMEEVLSGFRVDQKMFDLKMMRDTISTMLAFYRSQPITHSPMGTLLEGIELDAIFDWLHPSPKDDKHRALVERIQRLFQELKKEADKQALIVQGHGDLNLGNMLLGADQRIYLVDWEHTGPTTLPGDFSKLLARCPSGSSDVEQAMLALCAPTHRDRLASFTTQKAVGQLMILNRRAKDLGAMRDTTSETWNLMVDQFFRSSFVNQLSRL